MIPIVAASLKFALLKGGWYRHTLGRQTLPGVLALCYHGIRTERWRADEVAFPELHISPSRFEAHCRLIAETCHPISLSDWRASISLQRPLPERAVLVTFDDGYRSVFAQALPLLKRYRIPAAVFICTDLIRRQRLFWFDAMARSCGVEAVGRIRAARTSIPALGSAPDIVADASDPLSPMTVDHIKAAADAGVEFGAHGDTHLPLAAGTPEQQQADLATCRDTLSNWIGEPVRSLAYPWGTPGVDYTPQTVRIAEQLGFDHAFTTGGAFASQSESPLERSRFLVLSTVTAAELAHRIAYAWPR